MVIVRLLCVLAATAPRDEVVRIVAPRATSQPRRRSPTMISVTPASPEDVAGAPVVSLGP